MTKFLTIAKFSDITLIKGRHLAEGTTYLMK